MTSPGQPPPDFQQLVDELLNGTLSAEGLRDLESALRESPAAQAFFRTYCQLHVDLTMETRADRALDIIQQLPQNGATADQSKSGILGHLTFPDGPFQIPGLGAFVLLLSGLLLIGAVWFSRRPVPAQHDKPQPIATATFPVATEFRLDSGSAEMALARGVSVVLQGPARLELLGVSRARLLYGKIKVRITDPVARGFVVETPNGEVTDLGTEFGLDVAKDGTTGLAVFEGAVDLRISQLLARNGQAHVERLEEGDGVVINARGELVRVVSVFAGDMAVIRAVGEIDPRAITRLITNVSDNLRTSDTKKFYEIVPRGLCEDALAFVDRPEHDWNGVDESGMPRYVLGADYVKPFNDDKQLPNIEVTVTLAKPARLFVFFDDRVPVPDWLMRDFRDTGDDIGIDVGPLRRNGVQILTNPRNIGPGKFNNRCSIWERVVKEPGKVTLGSAGAPTIQSNMYGIAAVPLDADNAQ